MIDKEGNVVFSERIDEVLQLILLTTDQDMGIKVLKFLEEIPQSIKGAIVAGLSKGAEDVQKSEEIYSYNIQKTNGSFDHQPKQKLKIGVVQNASDNDNAICSIELVDYYFSFSEVGVDVPNCIVGTIKTSTNEIRYHAQTKNGEITILRFNNADENFPPIEISQNSISYQGTTLVDLKKLVGVSSKHQ